MVKSVSQPVRRIRTPIRARENDSDSGPSLVQLRMGMFQQAGLHQAGPSGLVVRGQPAGQAHGQQGRPQEQLGPLEQQIGDVQLNGAPAEPAQPLQGPVQHGQVPEPMEVTDNRVRGRQVDGGQMDLTGRVNPEVPGPLDQVRLDDDGWGEIDHLGPGTVPFPPSLQ